MRISIVGDSVCARALRDRCSNSKFAVADDFFDYRITIEEDPKVYTIGIDGVKGRDRDIEDCVEDMIGERLREANLDVRITKFPVGGVRAVNEVVVIIPPNHPEIERSVEIGCFNALGWLVRRQNQNQAPPAPPAPPPLSGGPAKPPPPPSPSPPPPQAIPVGPAPVGFAPPTPMTAAHQSRVAARLLDKIRGRAMGLMFWILLTCVLLAGRGLFGQPIILPPGAGAGGTQYSSGSTQATPTGTVALGQDSGNVLRALLVDASRNLVVSCAVGCSATGAFTDNTAFTAGTTTETNVGGIFNDGLGAVTSGNAAAARITAQRGLHINLRNNAGAETGVAAVPLQVSLANTASNATAVKVDGSSVTQPVSGTFFQATQPVSATSLPLPTGASTAAKQPALGTAGSAASDVITIQGVASMTKLLVTPDSVALPANQSVNVSQMGGVTTSMNTGVRDTGTQRVTIATNDVVPASQSGTWNITNVSGTVSLPTGAATETTLGTRLADATFTGRINTQGQKTMAGSTPVVLSSDQSTLNVNCASGCVAGGSFTDNSAFTAGTTAESNVGGVFNDGLSAVTSGNGAAARITAQRGLHINLRNNAGAETGVAAVPLQVSLANTAANATAVKVDGSGVTQPVSGTFWQATQPVSASSLPLPTGAATEASLVKIPLAQGSTTSGQSGALTQGAVTTAAPSYTTAQTSPLSLTTAGNLRVDGSTVTQPVSGTFWQATQPVNVSQVNGVATTVTGTLQSAAVANGNGTPLSIRGLSSAVMTVNCSACSGGTLITFEASEDATNFTSLKATQIGTDTIATSTSASGITVWGMQVAGYQTLRARISAYSAGTVTVTGTAVFADFNPKTLNANLFVGGTAAATGTGAGGAGIPRVTISNDSSLAANQSVNTAQINGVTPLMGNGATGTGAMRVSIANDSTGVVQPGNTANTTPWLGAHATEATTANSALTAYLTSAASTNSTSVKGSAGNVYGYSLINTTATLAYLRMYNSASAPTCSSATGYVESIPIPASTTGAGIERWQAVPQGFTTGIGFCLTGGGSSTDNSNAVTGIYVAVLYK